MTPILYYSRADGNIQMTQHQEMKDFLTDQEVFVVVKLGSKHTNELLDERNKQLLAYKMYCL